MMPSGNVIMHHAISPSVSAINERLDQRLIVVISDPFLPRK